MRFSIRDLLWLTVVVALAVGWWLERGRLLQEVADLSALKKPTIQAVVTNVDDARNLVEISLGSDAGLKLRDVVEVYRGKQLLGRVAIQRLDLDKAVGRIDSAAGPIQKGDNVLFVYDPPITIRAGPVPPSNH
jgi:hypothetical protein